MTYEDAKKIFIAHIACNEKQCQVEVEKRCAGECGYCALNYEKGSFRKQNEAFSIAIDAINRCLY